jgi:hypothetical protein
VLDALSKVTGWWRAPGHSDPLSLHRISSDVMTGRPPALMAQAYGQKASFSSARAAITPIPVAVPPDVKMMSAENARLGYAPDATPWGIGSDPTGLQGVCPSPPRRQRSCGHRYASPRFADL